MIVKKLTKIETYKNDVNNRNNFLWNKFELEVKGSL